MKLLLIALALFGLSCAEQFEFVPLDEATKARLDFSDVVLRHGEVEPVAADTDKLRNAVINDRIIRLLESARGSFETGSDSLPPLDPFSYDQVGPVDFEYSFVVKGDLTLTDIEVRGLKEFIIQNINFRIIGLNLAFDFLIPEVIYNSHYAINSRVGLIRWRPSGNARVNLHQVSVSGSASIGTERGHLVLRAFQVAFDIETSDVDIEGLIGNGLINIIFNSILNRVSDQFIQDQKDRASAWASEELFDIINEALKGFTLEDLLD